MKNKGQDINFFKKRLTIAFRIFAVLLFIACFNIGIRQLVVNEKYEKIAINQNLRDEVIKPKRGKILDANGQNLAVSNTTYSIWARTKDVSTGSTRLKRAARVDETAKQVSEILRMDERQVRKIITSPKTIIKIKKYQSKATAKKIKDAKLPGIYVEEEVKRIYPRGNFMSQVLGSVTDDNKGLAGLEQYYNAELSGVPGRWLKNTDVAGRGLSFGTKKYYKQSEGYNIILNIDSVIQNYAESEVRKVRRRYSAKSVSCIIMETKTGGILAMATSPGYNPNNPRKPALIKDRDFFERASNKRKLKYLNEMWRNPMVSNTYEPGSTAKLITLSGAVEEGLTKKSDYFHCSGYYTVLGQKIRCWSYTNPHGSENLTQAVGNSCNPVFMQLAIKLGVKRYYEYMGLFGLNQKTNIDFPGEAGAIVVPEKKATKLDLATMGFGQTNAVTAIQLVSAVSAIGNEGMLMQPRFVKKITDSGGRVVKEFKPKKVRQAISKNTASQVCDMMEYVVTKGGGKKAYIQGYRVGGKTGTAQKAGKGGYTNKIVASFIGMAPMDDPEVTILFVIDSPAGDHYGGTIAAPAAKNILKKVLKYKDISARLDNRKITETTKGKKVPNLIGMKYSKAKALLNKAKIPFRVAPKGMKKSDFVVKDQYPSSGTRLERNGVVYLYKK